MDFMVTSPHTKRLARRLVLIAEAACDLQDPEVASQMLNVAETFLRSTMLAPKDRYGVAELIVVAHHRLWHLRHLDGTGPRAGIVEMQPAGVSAP